MAVRRAHTVIPGCIAVYWVLLAVTRGDVVLVPSLSDPGGATAPLLQFVPISLAAGLMLSLESRPKHWEDAAVRRVDCFDAALAVATTSAGAAIALVHGFLVGADDVVATGRNAVFLIGIMLCARLWLGTAAISVPVLWLFAVFLVGFRSPHDPYPWTVVAEPLRTPHALIATVVAFAAGTLSFFIAPRRRS
ncbi:hypothetical protein ACFYNL_15040 [Streptomyces sp. NPDC007808]|uniref:hypothetical protein n=1 Tax=Streptomyces sp. NPDC007808 TaxID=3364779 RepID=UPI0036A5C098